jgi:hypothetical protein
MESTVEKPDDAWRKVKPFLEVLSVIGSFVFGILGWLWNLHWLLSLTSGMVGVWLICFFSSEIKRKSKLVGVDDQPLLNYYPKLRKLRGICLLFLPFALAAIILVYAGLQISRPAGAMVLQNPPAPGSRAVTVALIDSSTKQLLKRAFSISYFAQGKQHNDEAGANGSIRLPDISGDELDILSIECEAYRKRDASPFKIKQDLVQVIMRHIGSNEPVIPAPFEAYPSIREIWLPADEDLREAEVDPQTVTFDYLNTCGKDLTLYMCDCYLYMEGSPRKTSPGSSLWFKWPFESNQPHEFAEFKRGKGCFLFFVREANGPSYYLGRQRIFDSRNPRLTVSRTKNDAQPFKAQFEFK